MRAYERFLKYAAVRTPSDESSGTFPSSECQFQLAHILADELKALGVQEVEVSEYCYVYGKLPATAGHESSVKLGLIAHMDTVSDFCDHQIIPVIHENYDGQDLPLGESGRTLSVKNFPHLPELAGRTLITSDGTTVLGADDKAGIAEILTLIERLKEEHIPHGPLRIAFTPDEEIGAGTANFDLAKFDADYAYTLDGGPEGEVEYETFNAASAVFEIQGFNVHPGSSKDTMINAALVGCEINQLLPGCETPRGTEGYEGFYHLCSFHGDVANASLQYIIRDHDKHMLESRKNTLRLIAKNMNEKWGAGTVALTLKDQYQNMAEIIKDHMHLIENARLAWTKAHVTPINSIVRGGTDGCQLSFKGLPCPNLGTGGYAYHGPFEHITAEAMDLTVDMTVELIKIYAEQRK